MVCLCLHLIFMKTWQWGQLYRSFLKVHSFGNLWCAWEIIARGQVTHFHSAALEENLHFFFVALVLRFLLGSSATVVSRAPTPAFFLPIWNTAETPKRTSNSALLVREGKPKLPKQLHTKTEKKPERGDRYSPGSQPRREKTERCYGSPYQHTWSSDGSLPSHHLGNLLTT